MSKGVVLIGEDEVIAGRARRARLEVVTAESGPPQELPFEKTLVVEAGTRVPWSLLPAAWYFLDHWDAAVPLWRYGETAATLGTAEERKLTAGIVRDLRVLVHAVELVFVRNTEQGQELIAGWGVECRNGADKRLAFLRAVYQVKPRLCVLPRSWLAEVRQYDRQFASGARARQRSMNAGKPLVTVELEPGRLVKCHQGDEERVLAHFQRQRQGR